MWQNYNITCTTTIPRNKRILCGLRLEEDIFWKSAAADISFDACLLLFSSYVEWERNIILNYSSLAVNAIVIPGVYKYGKRKSFHQNREIKAIFKAQ